MCVYLGGGLCVRERHVAFWIYREREMVVLYTQCDMFDSMFRVFGCTQGQILI